MHKPTSTTSLLRRPLSLRRVALAALMAGLASLPAWSSVLPDSAMRSVVRLPATEVDGIRVAEISGLAWDADEQLLYAVSDRGYLYRFRVVVEAGKLKAVEPLNAYRIPGQPAQAESAGRIDAEGLEIVRGNNGVVGDAELLVSTEGRPQVLRLSTDGRLLETLAPPAALADAQRYRADNTMLEAVAHSPQFGLLLAAEVPLLCESPGWHEIHAQDRTWRFPVLDASRSHLKAMDVTADGKFVVLERAGKGRQLINALRGIRPASCAGLVACHVEELLHLDRAEGAENFEGMAYLGEQRFLVVSDNLGSKQTPTVFMLIDLSQRSRE